MTDDVNTTLARSDLVLSDRLLANLVVRGPIIDLCLDLFLVATVIGTWISSEVVVWFHAVFLTAAVLAFRLPTQALLIRTLPALALVTTRVVRAWQTDLVPGDEVLEIPLLTAIVAVIAVVRWRQRLYEEQLDRQRQLIDDLNSQTRRSLENQLESSQRFNLTSQVAAGAVHDINNLLTTIQFGAEDLLDAQSNEQKARSLAQVESAIRTGRALNQGVLGLIRGTDSSAGTDFQETAAAAAALAARAVPRRIQVSTRQQGPEGRVPLRREQVQQIVLNLVMNAAESILLNERDGRPEAQGTIRVATTVNDGRATVIVADNGPGMTDHTRARAAEPLFTTKATGTGLGLATIANIVAGVEGSMTIDSELGTGTTITVDLPAECNPPTNLQGTLLLADDDQLTRSTMATRLANAGFRCLEASNGHEALDLLAQTPEIQVVVTDLDMPVMDGWEFMAQLSALGDTRPVIVIAGLDAAVVRQSTSRPAYTLQKPVELNVLLDAVHDLVGPTDDVHSDGPSNR